MKKFFREIAVLSVAAVLAVCEGCASAEPEEAPYPCELAGSVWRPAEIRRGAYLEFTPDFRVVGSSGRNRFFGPVRCAPGKRMRMIVAYTMNGGELDEWEKKFFAALNDTRGYVFDDDKLFLYSEEREKLAEFRMLRPPQKVQNK